MDQQLKTRLIGVTIIVSLVVIFVPMLFEESSDRDGGNVGTAAVPEFPQEFESQALPLPTATPKPATAAPLAKDEPEAVPLPTPTREEPLDPLDVPVVAGGRADEMADARDAAAESQDALLPEKAPAKSDASPRDAKAATPTPKAKPPAKAALPAKTAAAESKAVDAKSSGTDSKSNAVDSKSNAVEKPKAKPAPVAESTAKAPAAPAPAVSTATKPKPAASKSLLSEAKPAAAVPAADAGKKLVAWVVQAGSFSDEANAKTLMAKLRKANIAAFVEMIPGPGGNSYRVRVGPELERARAEAILKKMDSEAGVKGMIVSYP